MTRTAVAANVTIPPRHLQRIKAIIMADTVRGLVAAWRVIMRQAGDCWEAATTVDSTAYRLTRDQWGELCDAMIAGSKAQGHGGFTNGGGLWMNSGPSAQEVER